MELKQYQIVLVNLDPTIGSEIKKTRPCVIISPDEMNACLNTIIVAPMTTKSRQYPTRIKVRHKNQVGWIIIDQIRTIDKKRIIRILDSLTMIELKKVKETIKETLYD
jgi:mRNA interferase MazF